MCTRANRQETSSPNTMALVLVKLNMFSVVKRRINYLHILEGHFSKERRAMASRLQPGGCKVRSGVFPLKQQTRSHSYQEYGMMNHQLQLVEL